MDDSDACRTFCTSSIDHDLVGQLSMSKFLKFLGVWMLVILGVGYFMLMIALAQTYTGAWYLGLVIPLFVYMCWMIWIMIDD